MPSGAGVVRYDGKRGVVWRVKYRDATGAQRMETIGAERDGITWKHANEALQDRLSDVRRKGYRRPRPIKFGEYAETWFAEGVTRRRWKPSTVLQYRSTRARLVEAFGPMPLAAVRPRHLAEYVAAQSETLGASTVGRDVDLLHAIFLTAKREELVETNPAEGVERPRLPRRRWRILQPGEVGRVSRAFTDDRMRLVFLTLILTGLRRHELRNLRWADVDLLEGVLRVRESKTEEGERSIAVPPTLADALRGHWQGSRYRTDDDRVFCHPERGTPLDADRFAAAFQAALAAAGIHEHVRPFHDLRHSSLTNGAAAGEGSIALMTRAGHANMSTTKAYLHLAGVVFRDEAAALERRLLGAVESSTDLSASEPV